MMNKEEQKERIEQLEDWEKDKQWKRVDPRS